SKRRAAISSEEPVSPRLCLALKSARTAMRKGDSGRGASIGPAALGIDPNEALYGMDPSPVLNPFKGCQPSPHEHCWTPHHHPPPRGGATPHPSRGHASNQRG